MWPPCFGNSKGINISALINNNFFISNMNLVCGLNSRIARWKFKLIEKERRALINNNFFMSNMNLVCGLNSRIARWKFKLIEKERRLLPISVEIWALRDKGLRNDPNESSAVHLLTFDDKHAVCGTDFSPMQINFFAENISDDSSLCRRLSITCHARKKIKFHRCSS